MFFDNYVHWNSLAVLYSDNGRWKNEAVLFNEPVGWQKRTPFHRTDAGGCSCIYNMCIKLCDYSIL